MPNDYETMARALMSSSEGARIFQTLDKVSAVAASPSGRQLITMLAGSGSDALKSAAAAANATDKDPARVLISSLLSSKEGSALIGKIVEVIGVK